MGTYIDRGNVDFAQARNSTYVDKSGLIAVINETLFTEQRRSCVTRSRRFGKSMAANMLCAYYDRSCDSRALFADLEIAKAPSFEKYLNKFPVIKLDLTDFTTDYKDNPDIISVMQEKLKEDVRRAYPGIVPDDFKDGFMDMLISINQATGDSFIMVIDEWDAICREFEPNSKVMDSFVNWLRRMFKGSNTMKVFAGVYMTGILPIKKYKTESALNNFMEYSVTSPMNMARYFGFTRGEVKKLCEAKGRNFSEMEQWYDGYKIGLEPSIFNPNSVMMALSAGYCRSFWAKTGAYDQVATYIDMNYEGLKDDIIYMLSGGRCDVETNGFGNDMNIVRSKDEVLTVLIHLGYLAYDFEEEKCYIPNYEVRREMENAVKSSGWQVAQAITGSKKLLEATLAGDSDYVAQAIDKAHDENTSILSYNNENSLACVLTIAYLYAQNDYVVHRELATGKGFADLVLIPRKNIDKPAIVLELKFNQDVEAAIDQIRRRTYVGRVAQHTGDILLVGINYDKKEKTHSCAIEKVHI
ncbi:MAG: AAA family ATPase [Bacteroidaceae bacterium]|nr:AAA family ATPase [Bacteroidaceae bacterium]